MKRPLKNPTSVPGACNTSWTPVMVGLWWAQLWDGTGCVSFPVGQQGTADTLCTLTHIPQPFPTLWQAKTEGVVALHLGCPNANSEALEPGTCFSTQVPLWPKLKQSPSSSSSPPKGNKIALPPVFTAEGRGQREGMALWDATSRKWSSVCQRWDTNMTEEPVVFMR